MKVGFKGVYISQICFPDDIETFLAIKIKYSFEKFRYLIFAQNIDHGYMLKWPSQVDSNEYSQTTVFFGAQAALTCTHDIRKTCPCNIQRFLKL